MAKTDFKKVTIQEGRTESIANKKPVQYITIETMDGNEFSIEYDSNYRAYCIIASTTKNKGKFKFIGEGENSLYFKLK